ncbi:MAG: hypothetical protein M1834_002497 [Cirrosporium novae-zelandiae]|nr:MAG: hypothetical protein M1834_002497 [Cirrosporium novae-zelandiae]
MDSKNLETASLYLNNLLLSRGLLRNGQPIDFAHPFKPIEGPDPTMAKLINLVHDMILRRDKEAEQRESLAHTIHSLRTSAQQQNASLERLQERNTELQRQISLAEGQERAYKSSIKSAEFREKKLKEETLRLRTTVQQVRTQCANDIRKRDIQIQKMKGHLNGLQRGKRDGFGATTITITPPPPPGRVAPRRGGLDEIERLNSPDYSLRQETNEFLTGLCQQLSDENDALIGLVRNSLETLRSLQGLPEASTLPLLSEEDQLVEDTTAVVVPPTSYENLSADMDAVLEHLRTILTNPSFVPIEEVAIREDEIVRLREGWEKMEGRWKEAIAMMDSWRKRMLGGDVVNLDELTTQLKDAQSTDLRLDEVLEKDRDEDKDEVEDEVEDEDEEDEVVEGEEEEEVEYDDKNGEGSLDGSIEIESQQTAVSSEVDWLHLDDSPVKSYGRGNPKLDPPIILTETSGNGRYQHSRRKRPFTSVIKEITKDSEDENEIDEVDLVQKRPPSSTSVGKSPTRLPIRTHTHKPLTEIMTVEEKLRQAEMEANIVKERNKRDKSKTSKHKVGAKKASNRRRSTLSPEELEGLMGISG